MDAASRLTTKALRRAYYRALGHVAWRMRDLNLEEVLDLTPLGEFFVRHGIALSALDRRGVKAVAALCRCATDETVVRIRVADAATAIVAPEPVQLAPPCSETPGAEHSAPAAPGPTRRTMD